VGFSPNFKIGWDITKKVNAGFEYYGALGPITGFDPVHDQQQQFFPCVDLNLSEKWEFNAGIGVGVTRLDRPPYCKDDLGPALRVWASSQGSERQAIVLLGLLVLSLGGNPIQELNSGHNHKGLDEP